MLTEAASGLPAEQRAAIQRHTLWVLMAGQILGSASLGAAFAVGSFIIKDIVRSGSLGGIASASFTLGAAGASIPLSRLMSRRGRRVGLEFGYLLAVLGGIVAIVGAQNRLLVVYLPGQFLFGIGQASNLLGRYAATDLAQPDQRSRAISRVLVCSTFGAVLGPSLVAPAEHVATALNLYRYTGPYLFSTVFLAGATLNIHFRLRPDPLAVLGRLATQRRSVPRLSWHGRATPSGRRHAAAAPVDAAQVAPVDAASGAPPMLDALRTIAAHPRARLALLAMVVAQSTMVGVMTMTPLHMQEHHHEGISQYVISLHVAGMYAFSPLVGRYSDRRGRLPTLAIAGGLLMGATVVAALAGHFVSLLFLGLWLLGLGWSFGLIGGSALLTESVPLDQRLSVQGSADVLMSLCGAAASFSSGFIRNAWGFHMLANLGTLIAGVLAISAITVLQVDRRQRPVVELAEVAVSGGAGGG